MCVFIYVFVYCCVYVFLFCVYVYVYMTCFFPKDTNEQIAMRTNSHTVDYTHSMTVCIFPSMTVTAVRHFLGHFLSVLCMVISVFFFLCPPSQWTEEDEIADYERNMEWMDECMDGMLEKWYDKVVQGTLESRRKVNKKVPPDK